MLLFILIMMSLGQDSDCVRLDGGLSFWVGNIKTKDSWSNYLTGEEVTEELEYMKKAKDEECRNQHS